MFNSKNKDRKRKYALDEENPFVVSESCSSDTDLPTPSRPIHRARAVKSASFSFHARDNFGCHNSENMKGIRYLFGRRE
jgi:hypothetical protein